MVYKNGKGASAHPSTPPPSQIAQTFVIIAPFKIVSVSWNLHFSVYYFFILLIIYQQVIS